MAYLIAGIALFLILGISIWQHRTRTKRKLRRAVKHWKKKPLHPWDQGFLRSKRLVQDPLADEIVKEIFEAGDVEHINHFYNSIHRTSEDLPDELPQYLRDYFNTAATLPYWADKYLIERGEDFYIEHGPTISLVLTAKSLPECYACANGAEVLYRTGRLSEKHGSMSPYTRRVAETAQFIMNCMAPGGLSPNGQGIRSAQKIRLIHSTIRYYLHKEGWDEEEYGHPINQEDLAGTLMSFGPLVLEGLKKLGFYVTEEEKEAYMHCWRLVGYFMGLDEDLLPNNARDAHNLGYAILRDQQKASKQGTELTKSLIEFLTLMSPNGQVNLVVDDLIRMMIGDDIADMLEVPPVSPEFEKEGSEIAKEFVGGWDNIEDRHMILREICKPLNQIVMTGMLRLMNKGEKIHFFIPPSLQGEWGVQSQSQ